LNTIYQAIDQDTAWFIVAVLLILLLSVAAGAVGAMLELREIQRQRRVIDARPVRIYTELETPAYLRQTRHPLDSVEFDWRATVQDQKRTIN
jgi:hypothetical protein